MLHLFSWDEVVVGLPPFFSNTSFSHRGAFRAGKADVTQNFPRAERESEK